VASRHAHLAPLSPRKFQNTRREKRKSLLLLPASYAALVALSGRRGNVKLLWATVSGGKLWQGHWQLCQWVGWGRGNNVDEDKEVINHLSTCNAFAAPRLPIFVSPSSPAEALPPPVLGIRLSPPSSPPATIVTATLKRGRGVQENAPISPLSCHPLALAGVVVWWHPLFLADK
jgi:hypothetical protein